MENKINLKTKYKVRVSFDDPSSVNDIIISYYLPLIQSKSFSLYSTLLLDSRNTMINTIFISIDRIVSMLNLSFEDIENAITKLEIVNLIKIFKYSDDKIIFHMLKPLSPKEFNNSFQLRELLKSAAGNNNFEISNKLFNSLKDHNLDHDLENLTKKLKVDKTKGQKLNVSYDFDLIKSVLIAKKIDWNSFWNKDLEQVILDLVIVYRISAFDIAIEIIEELKKGSINLDSLRDKIRINFEKGNNFNSIIDSGNKTKEIKLEYLKEMNVKDYFVSKLNRVPSPKENKMIVKLNNEYRMKNDMINILIDYSILVNDGAINENYIFKIADTSLKENINTSEKLIQHLRVSYKMKKTKNVKEFINKNIQMKDKPIF